MYKAIKKIGGYKVGDEVPIEKAIVWLEMYVEPHVEKIDSEDVKNDFTNDDEFFKELTKTDGIGKKTAKDIVVWGTKEKLIEAIKLKADLPFRDDIVNKLIEKYG